LGDNWKHFRQNLSGFSPNPGTKNQKNEKERKTPFMNFSDTIFLPPEILTPHVETPMTAAPD